MTSNVGSNVIAKGASQLGFSLPTDEADGGHYTQIRSLVLEELKVRFQDRNPTSCFPVFGHKLVRQDRRGGGEG